MNLDWIEDLINQIPKTSKHRKNLIEIAGYPKWENVNSNLLAFYFDEKEDHEFGRLFFNSLIELYDYKIEENIELELFETDYSVEREVFTDAGGRIDIVIKEETGENNDNEKSSWAIIIENKLYADLYNSLDDYWHSVDSEPKFGIVLSVNPVQIDGNLFSKEIKFVNILHKELVEKVKQNLSDFYLDSNDRHLLFLKEYISNVNSYYKDTNKMKQLDKTLQLFHSKKEQIEELKKADLDLLRYVSKSVFDIMEDFGFPPYSRKDSSKGKHFHISEDNSRISKAVRENIELARKFRFWININHLRYNGSFEGVFELYGKKNTVYGDRLKSELEKRNIYSSKVQIGTYGKSGTGYQHILYISIPIPEFSETGFDTELRNVLKNELFEHEKQYIDSVILTLKELIDNERDSAG